MRSADEPSVSRNRDVATQISLLWDSLSAQWPVVAERLAKKLGAALRKRRGELTYAQFARKVGIGHSTLHRLEMGDQNITLKTIEQLTKRLKCSVGELFGE
jgi:DNA-binding Xre family transcriptional regulator